MASASKPAQTLKQPKKAASSSVAGMCTLAIALNCHAAIPVTSDENAMTTASARRYGDLATMAKLSQRLVGVEPRPCTSTSSSPNAAGRRCQIANTSTAHAARATASANSTLSAPYRPAVAVVMSPPTTQPRIAPPPTRPNRRFPSRRVST